MTDHSARSALEDLMRRYNYLTKAEAKPGRPLYQAVKYSWRDRLLNLERLKDNRHLIGPAEQD